MGAVQHADKEQRQRLVGNPPTANHGPPASLTLSPTLSPNSLSTGPSCASSTSTAAGVVLPLPAAPLLRSRSVRLANSGSVINGEN